MTAYKTTTLPKRLIAIGDIHGAANEFFSLIHHFNLIDKEGKWHAKDTTFVQIGDIVDRGYDCKTVYEALLNWQKQAPAYNSAVHFITGNHEVMNMYGVFHYNTAEEYKAFATKNDPDGSISFTKAFTKGGWLNRWISQQPVMLQFGPVIFAHADLPQECADQSIEEINEEIHNAFQKPIPSRVNALPPCLFSNEKSVLWSREAQRCKPETYGPRLNTFLSRHKASVYVCGHTVNNRFVVDYDGHYLCIDTGISPYYQGAVSALLIANNKASEIIVNETETIERDVPLAL